MSLRSQVLDYFLQNPANENTREVADCIRSIVESDLDLSTANRFLDGVKTTFNTVASMVPGIEPIEEDKTSDDAKPDEATQTRERLLAAFFEGKRTETARFVHLYCRADLAQERSERLCSRLLGVVKPIASWYIQFLSTQAVPIFNIDDFLREQQRAEFNAAQEPTANNDAPANEVTSRSTPSSPIPNELQRQRSCKGSPRNATSPKDDEPDSSDDDE